MYNQESNNTVQISLSIKDLDFILAHFKTQIKEFKVIIKEYLQYRLEGSKEEEKLNEVEARWNDTINMITEIGHILNCVLFLGGYNSKLQEVVTIILLEKGSLFL